MGMYRFLAMLVMAILVAAPSPSLAKRAAGNLTGVLLPYVPPAPSSTTGTRGEPKGAVTTNTAVDNRPAGVTPEREKSAEGSAKKKGGSSPISITALRMEADNKAGWVLFIGKVKAIQKDMVLTSGRLKVFLDDKGKVKRVIATGGVKVEQAGRVITSSKAEYDPLKETVTFTGNPKAWQGKNVVMGKRIVYFVKEKRSTVEGGNGKVSAVLFPKEKKGGK